MCSVRTIRNFACLVAIGLAMPGTAAACPFCSAVQPTLAQRRESAKLAAIAEVLQSAEGRQQLRVHKVLHGVVPAGSGPTGDPPQLELQATGKFRPADLVLAFVESEDSPGKLQGTAVAAGELAIAYFAQAPDLRQPAAKRLAYFVRFLEHADPLLAEDAFLEFGHAPFTEVVKVADRLPQDKLRGWIVDRKISSARKGFYGLALGLATSDDDRRRNTALLREQILAEADDFRAGFDGMLAGYVLLTGDEGVKLLDERYFSNPKARDGDVRNAIRALRFCHDSATNVKPERLNAAMRGLLSRREFAAGAIVDLARWKDWQALDAVVKLYDSSVEREPAINRAVVGYLSACDEPAAAAALAGLRRRDPKGVAAAEKELAAFPAGSSN